MKRVVLIIVAGLLLTIGAGAQTISLESTIEATRASFPLLRQKPIQSKVGEDLRRALWYAYFPQLSMEGRTTYQSHVTELDIALPSAPGTPPMQLDLPEMPKLQYNAYLQATQLIWDGGRVAAGSKMLRAETDTKIAEVDVEMRKVEEAVTELYFSLLMLERQLQLQEILIAELDRQKGRVDAALKSGVAMENDLDYVQVELLKAQQSLEQLRISRQAVLDALAVYTGEEYSSEVVAVVPSKPLLPTHQGSKLSGARPENALLDAKLRSAEGIWRSYLAGGMPTIALFARGGYGRPGLNMLNPDPMTYYIAGLTLSWDFGQLYDYSLQKSRLRGTSQLIELQREALEKEVASKEAEYGAEVRQYQTMVEKDREVVALRKKIADRGRVQETEGTLATVDYLRQISEYHAAEQTAEVHHLQYLRSLYRQKNNLGL